MLYGSKIFRVFQPPIFIITPSDTPARLRFGVAVRRRSWKIRFGQPANRHAFSHRDSGRKIRRCVQEQGGVFGVSAFFACLLRGSYLALPRTRHGMSGTSAVLSW